MGFISSKIIKKLFSNYKNEEWTSDYFEMFTKENIGGMGLVQTLKFEDNKVTLHLKYNRKIEFFILNKGFPKSVLFAYRIHYQIKESVLYGVIVKDEDEIMDLNCYPHSCMEYSIAEYQGSLYNIKTSEIEKYDGLLNKTIDNTMTKNEFSSLINETLKEENLLVKNAIYKIF